MSDDQVLAIITDIRNWIRATSFGSVRQLLESALPDEKSRRAYQMLDGTASMEQVRIACKLSPNGLLAMTQRWTSMGLMEFTPDKKRTRLFDLADFGLLGPDDTSEKAKQK